MQLICMHFYIDFNPHHTYSVNTHTGGNMNEPVYKQIRLPEGVDKKLNDLSKARKAEGALVKTKQDVLSELVINAHKKEVK